MYDFTCYPNHATLPVVDKYPDHLPTRSDPYLPDKYDRSMPPDLSSVNVCAFCCPHKRSGVMRNTFQPAILSVGARCKTVNHAAPSVVYREACKFPHPFGNGPCIIITAISIGSKCIGYVNICRSVNFNSHIIRSFTPGSCFCGNPVGDVIVQHGHRICNLGIVESGLG